MHNLKLFIKYTLVGGIAAILDILILFVLVDVFGYYYLSSAVISFTIATIFAFIFQKRFTFNDNNSRVTRQVSYFFLIAMIGLLLYVGFIYLFVTVLGIWYLAAAAMSKGLCFIWNFSLNNFITFSLEEA